jgi:prepilin-type N-terminal cleavage/methylation domain-containing protein
MASDRIELRSVALRKRTKSGFTVLELMVVITIALIVVGFAVPQVMTTIHAYRLRGAAQNMSSLTQTVRWRAVQDDQFYSARFATPSGALEGYVDLAKSGALASGDPQTVIDSEVNMKPAAGAPNTAALRTMILPAGSLVVPKDGDTLSTATPITFGPRGLPCLPTATHGGTVCDSVGGSQAYWIFFQDRVTNKWAAVTITPAGRIQTWFYENGWALDHM